jgi:hypothetical protein
MPLNVETRPGFSLNEMKKGLPTGGSESGSPVSGGSTAKGQTGIPLLLNAA